MSNPKKTVLITGCSDGSLGAGLAVAFHNAGLRVYATARNPAKMRSLEALGIETLTLDVLDDTSIAKTASEITQLDILVNNAGASYAMPISDLSITEAKKLFDLNVWSYLAVTQAFLPLILKSQGIIVNQTSVSSACTVPFQSAYNASKAAIAAFSDTQRFELAPFGVRVVDLKTGAVHSNIYDRPKTRLPKDSIYAPAREAVEKSMSLEDVGKAAMNQEVWAKATVADLLKKSPPPNIWRGTNAWLVWLGTKLPFGWLDGTVKKITGLDVVEEKLR